MVNYKGHLFAFRVPFIQAMTSLQAQINEDQHPLAIRCRRLTFSSTKVAYSPRSSHPSPASLHPSNFVLESPCDAPPIRGRPFNDRSPNLLARRDLDLHANACNKERSELANIWTIRFNQVRTSKSPLCVSRGRKDIKTLQNSARHPRASVNALISLSHWW